jgi:hypothetical protein
MQGGATVTFNGLRSAITVLALFTAMLVTVDGGVSVGWAEESNKWAVDQVQRAVRDQITRDNGNLAVRFANDTRTESPSKTNYRVHGSGTAVRDRDGKSRPFAYDAVVSARDRRVSDVHYRWQGDWGTPVPDRLTRTEGLDHELARP